MCLDHRSWGPQERCRGPDHHPVLGPWKGQSASPGLTPVTVKKPPESFPALEFWNSRILVLWFAQEDRGKPFGESKDISELLILKKTAKGDGLGSQLSESPTRAHETSAGGRAQKGPWKLISGFALGVAGRHVLDAYMRDGVRTEGPAAMNRERMPAISHSSPRRPQSLTRPGRDGAVGRNEAG